MVKSDIPNIRAGMHVFPDVDEWPGVQVCLIKGRGLNNREVKIEKGAGLLYQVLGSSGF